MPGLSLQERKVPPPPKDCPGHTWGALAMSLKQERHEGDAS